MKSIFLTSVLSLAIVACSESNNDDETINHSTIQTTDTTYITVPIAQTPNNSLSDSTTLLGGIKLNFQMSGITKVELECVDAYALAGTATIINNPNETPYIAAIADTNYIITLEGELSPNNDYYITTLPCNVYGGYRLSIFCNNLVAHWFGVHQVIQSGQFIEPIDLVEDDLIFDDPDAPLVEEERPELDSTTKAILAQYQASPTQENKQALLDQMGIRYDKVVARKKSKLRELEREAKTYDVIEEMQLIVDEMVDNRDVRLQQQFLRLIDPRDDDDPNDAYMVLSGADANNPYIAYAPLTNAEYALFNTSHTYSNEQANFPVVSITIDEANDYCNYLTSHDDAHIYRLPTDEEWILAAGHMPKDVVINADGVEETLTAVDAYGQTTGACGGIDFWGNCWEWTSSTADNVNYIVKGGSFDSSRDDCRTEKSDVLRNGSQKYNNVGFRIVRTDK